MTTASTTNLPPGGFGKSMQRDIMRVSFDARGMHSGVPQRFWPLRHTSILFAFPLSFSQAMEVGDGLYRNAQRRRARKVMGATPTRVT